MAAKKTLAGGLHFLSDKEISETENRGQGSRTQPSYARRMIHTKAKWNQLVQMRGKKFRDPSTSRWSPRSSDNVIIPGVLCRYNQARSNFRRSKYIPVNNNAENKAPPSCAFLLSLIRSWRAWESLLPGGTEDTCVVKTPQDQYTVLTDGISSWRRSKRWKLEWIKNVSSKKRKQIPNRPKWLGLPQTPSHQNRCNAQELENRMRGVLVREIDPWKTSVDYSIHTAPLQQAVCQLVNHRFVGSLIQSTLTLYLC